mmetsp:Transcript_100337/g.323818  ORF Transcript_100337/g.323818 Transcript_100337/m.323818 type:complete len:221 (+) Transcript_100337:477-1139(+)
MPSKSLSKSRRATELLSKATSTARQRTRWLSSSIRDPCKACSTAPPPQHLCGVTFSSIISATLRLIPASAELSAVATLALPEAPGTKRLSSATLGTTRDVSGRPSWCAGTLAFGPAAAAIAGNTTKGRSGALMHRVISKDRTPAASGSKAATAQPRLEARAATALPWVPMSTIHSGPCATACWWPSQLSSKASSRPWKAKSSSPSPGASSACARRYEPWP